MKVRKSILMCLTMVMVLPLAACGARNHMDMEKKSIGHTQSEDKSMSSDKEKMKDEDSSMQTFPAFTGKDLEGNEVNSKDLFSENAVTVVNFWFTTCGPCVGELAELDALNKELGEKGGALIGINALTLDGDEMEISEAMNVLQENGASYRNVYFDKDSEAGTFADTIQAFPTTFVIDRDGNIVGEPVVGSVASGAQKDALKKIIDETIEMDMK